MRNNNRPLDEYYRIYTKKIALELRKQGFYIFGVEPNETFPQFNVYLFKDSPAFREALTKLTQRR